ncbi:MAG TPA: ABC transporter permease [Vicinamibacterales bacterium]
MTSTRLVVAGLRHYWRTNLAVIAGVATAVAVLAGALLVGDSVRGSLRDLALQRLGRVDRVVVSTGFFREALAGEIRADPAFVSSFSGVAPIVIVPGMVTDQASGRRASNVQVYGVDDRFWQFHHVAGQSGPDQRSMLISRALAAEVGAAPDATVVVRIERPSAIPIESLHARKDDVGGSLRLTVREVLGARDLGDFSLRPQQGDVRAAFVPLRSLQRVIDRPAMVNALLVADASGRAGSPSPPQGSLDALLKKHVRLEDVGLTVRPLDAQNVLSIESPAGLIDRRRSAIVEEAAARDGLTVRPVFTYLANAIRSGGRSVPYSLVTATDLKTVAPTVLVPSGGAPAIVVNDWTARDLGVRVGDPLTLEYYVWEDPGVLRTKAAGFTIAAVVPIAGAAADRDLAPVYPGITAAEDFGDWDPPFPIDLRRVRPQDEAYWKAYRTTPKAFIAFDEGRRLWQSRFGDRTSMRIPPAGLGLREMGIERSILQHLDPLAFGFSVQPVRADGLAASSGSTDFGEYFTYFSFFLVASALLLAVLFFRLSVEQRAREVGLLRAVGFTTARVRRLFTEEGVLLAAIGSALGLAGAVGYAAAMMTGLRTWWSGAVGTTALTLHVTAASLAAGALGALAAATLCIWWTLRGLSKLSERSLLAGNLRGDEGLPRQQMGSSRRWLVAAIVSALGGVGLVAATAGSAMDRTGAFFGAGSLLLVAALCALTFRLRRPGGRPLESSGGWPLTRLGARNTTERPGRSVLAIGVIASATFILIAVDAFRRPAISPTDRHSGSGGYSLQVDLLLPLASDPNQQNGREALGLENVQGITIEPFRVRPGDETSCLNLYEPTNPRIFGVSRRFAEASRFSFADSLASTDAERANPWLLLFPRQPDDIVPVIADANSMTYVLHKKLGDEIVVSHGDRAVRLKLVAALSDSIFQGELLMADDRFTALFPDQQGYRFLLIETPGGETARVASAIESGAADLGADAKPTAERLAEFHTVENTYLSTFQTLGGLGLLIGTVGLAAVVLRNVLERRRDLALLQAVGYRPAHLFALVLTENLVLLVTGLLVGTLCALVAIAPAAADRGARLPLTGESLLLLLAVLAAGLVSSLIATRAVVGMKVVAALRSE